MAPTIKNLAKELSLSTATVSRVLSGRGRELVSPETRERVLKAARQRQFRPNSIARALVTGKTHTVGVLTFALYPSHYTRILCHLKEIVDGAGFQMQINETLNQMPNHERLRQLTSWPVDGLLVFDSPLTFQTLRDMGLATPAVCFGTAVPDDDNVDRVWVDAYSATYAAVASLAEQGVKRLAFLGRIGDDDDRGGARVRAYLRVLGEYGLEAEEVFVPYWRGDGTTEGAGYMNALWRRKTQVRQIVADYVRAHGCPDAWFCLTDDIAIGALRGLLDAGVVVPRDTLLLGFDGSEDTMFQYVEMSTVDIPARQLCEEAWRLLARRMEQPDAPPEKRVLEARPLYRASSRRSGAGAMASPLG